MSTPTPTHDVAWFLANRLPELAAMGTWRLDPIGRIRGWFDSIECCPVSAPLDLYRWEDGAKARGLDSYSAWLIGRAADASLSHDPAIRAALLAALVPERAR